MSRNYYRVMLGRQSVNAAQCFAEGFIGINDSTGDLTGHLTESWRDFNQWFIPIFLARFPGKSRISAGLAGGTVWTVAKGIRTGDIVLCPNGQGQYRVGEVTGDYHWVPDGVLPHRRQVKWLTATIDRADMSDALKGSTGSIGTVSDISRHRQEIESLIGGTPPPALIASDATVEDPTAFAMEKHLEDFLVQNWAGTELGKTYDIFEDNGEKVGQQYATDTGPMDVLAVSKDKTQLLVVELKKGRASDVVVGQVLRYMGFVKDELAEPGQDVRGVIIALEDDQRIRRALSVAPNVDFYRYQVRFQLIKT